MTDNIKLIIQKNNTDIIYLYYIRCLLHKWVFLLIHVMHYDHFSHIDANAYKNASRL